MVGKVPRNPNLAVICLILLAPIFPAKEAHSKGRAVYHYEVTDHTPTLGEVSMYLYGTARMAGKIARWNSLHRPYHVYLGQRLRLREKPRISPEKGKSILLAFWRKRLNEQTTGSLQTDTARPGADQVQPEENTATTSALTDSQNLTARPPLPEPSPSPTPVLPDFGMGDYSYAAVVAPPTPPPAPSPEPEKVASRSHFELGQELFKKKDFSSALEHFHKAREESPENIAAWMSELKTLRQLRRHDEAQNTAKTFVDQFPTLGALPAVQCYLIKCSQFP